MLDGHDGTKAVTFSQDFIPHLLLRSELSGGDKRVMDALRSAIVQTEREFFIGIDPYITRKVTLQLEIEVTEPLIWKPSSPAFHFRKERAWSNSSSYIVC